MMGICNPGMDAAPVASWRLDLFAAVHPQHGGTHAAKYVVTGKGLEICRATMGIISMVTGKNINFNHFRCSGDCFIEEGFDCQGGSPT